MSSTITQLYHINFNFLSNWFYNAIIVDSLTAHSLLDHPSNIQLPQILAKLPELAYSTLLEQDKINLDMEKLATKMHNIKSHLYSNTQIQWTDISNLETVHNRSITTIITLAFHFITVISITVIIIVYIRLRNLLRLVLVLTTVSTAIPHTNVFALTHSQ